MERQLMFNFPYVISVLMSTMGLVSFSAGSVIAADMLEIKNQGEFPLEVPLSRISTLVPRAKPDPQDDQWMIGCEVLDRDFADFDQYKDYLVPLGIRSIRLQCGWAKCEQARGVYDFAWLDHQVDFALSKGLNPVLETDYGNPIYEGGGGRDLAAGFPSSEEGLKAWDLWVDALTRHFSGRVRDWAMWNEPDIRNPAVTDDALSRKTPKEIADFNIRTARIVRRNIPDSRIAGLSLATCRPEFHEACYQALGADIGLFNRFIYHGYARAPELSYSNVVELVKVCARYAPNAIMWQGENGCPSEMPGNGLALNHYIWSEYSQAKWDMRRMLGDLGHDIPSSIFTICDYYHPGRGLGSYGLLRADMSKTVIGVKRAFYSVRNVVTLFDSHIKRIKDQRVKTSDQSVCVYEYVRNGGRMFVFWTYGGFEYDNKARCWVRTFVNPGDSFQTRPAVFSSEGPAYEDPVWIDLASGGVYEFPIKNAIQTTAGLTFVNVPVYDSPCVIAERKAVHDTIK